MFFWPNGPSSPSEEHLKILMDYAKEINSGCINLPKMNETKDFESLSRSIELFERSRGGYDDEKLPQDARSPTDVARALLHARRMDRAPTWYSATQLMTFKTETVNGYELYPTAPWDLGRAIMYYDEYEGFARLLEPEEEEMTLDEFREAFNRTACSDWGKMDENGECYVGFYDYADDSLEYENAYDLTRDKNIRLLYRLPFPKRFILATVEYGCSNRLECVRYSNYLGVWVTRKRAQRERFGEVGEVSVHVVQ
jgi:hypothetical protein